MKRTKAQLIEELKAQAKMIASLQEANKANDIYLCSANDSIRAGITKHNEMSMEIQSLENQVKDMSDMLEARDRSIKTLSEKLCETEQQLELHVGDVAELNNYIQAQKKETERARYDAQVYKERLQSKEGELDELVEAHKILKTSYEHLKSRYRYLESKYTNQLNQEDFLASEIDNLKAELAEAYMKNNVLHQDIDRLSRKDFSEPPQYSLLLGEVEYINPTIEPEEPYTSKTADEAFYLLGKACSELSLIKKECTCGATNNLQ